MKRKNSIRLREYDYSKEGHYFVTFMPIDHYHPFCQIVNGKIEIYEIGKIVEDQSKWIFSRYDHIQMDEYVIMPDHFHGIIQILPESNDKCADYGANVGATLESPAYLSPANTNRAGPDPPVHLDYNNRLDLSHIIGAFKTTSSKLIHEAGYKDFKWKISFHDRILRMDEIEIKRQYIRNNPKKWE